MATPTKSTSSRDDVLQFLDSLDSYSAPAPRTPAASSADKPATPSKPAPPTSALPAPSAGPANAEEAQSVLDFLDEITQRSSTPTATVKSAELNSSLNKKPSASSVLGRSTSRNNLTGGAPPAGTSGGASASGAPPRRSTDSVRSQRSVHAGVGASSTPPLPTASAYEPAPASSATTQSTTPPEPSAQGGWGWSSVWSQASNVVAQASNVVQQARTVAEEQVKTASAHGGIGGLGEGLMKALGENEQAKKWSEGVMEYARGAHLDQIGKDLKSTTLRSLTDLLNAVAPPIAEHEVIEVSLSHDMVGYDGVETLVYRGLAKIMDQIEGGTLIVNKGNEATIKEGSVQDDERDLNLVEGLAEGWKLAEANLDQLIKTTYKPPAAIDPSESSLTVPVTTCPVYMRIQPVLAPLPFLSQPTDDPSSTSALFFLMLLRDPTHKLVHSSVSQSMPASWLEIPFEENEWVEDVMVDVIRRSVEVIGQEYISHRMRAQRVAITKAREEAQRVFDASHEEGVAAAAAAAPVLSEAEKQQQHEEASEAAALARATS